MAKAGPQQATPVLPSHEERLRAVGDGIGRASPIPPAVAGEEDAYRMAAATGLVAEDLVVGLVVDGLE